MAAKKHTPAQLSQEDELRIQDILARRQALAEELHGCTSRPQAEALLADVFSASESAQMGLLKSLVRASDADAADLLLAIHELAPEKTVRKEARRALIQLAGAKVVPSWTPAEEQAAVAGQSAENAPRFWKGQVMEARETGEIQLILCWEYGFEYGEARVMSFLLDYSSDGVAEFLTTTGTRRYINEKVRELEQIARDHQDPEEGPLAAQVDCTLAEGRRLLNEALEINRWRQTEPHKEFRQHLPLIQRLILHASEAGEDRGLTFIRHGEEPDMTVANFVGAWSMGDYGLCYDLLAPNSPLLEGRSRSEWIELRRNWFDEAHPSRFEVYFLREAEKAPQSALWVPTSVLSARAGGPKEIEICWSLELTDTPLSGTLLEMPMGTAVYKETGRHWFWTNFSLEQERGEWRILRLKDEGLAAQGLPVEELRRRVQEHDDVIQKAMNERKPDDPEMEKIFEDLATRIWKSLAFNDAILARNPQEKDTYVGNYARAMSMRAVERGAVYALALVERFPADPDLLVAKQRLAALEIAQGERYAALGLGDRAGHFVDLGEELLRGALSEEQPIGYAMLAELLVTKNELDEAEKYLLTARELVQDPEQKAEIEFNLANLAINHEHFPEAQGYLERLAELSPNYPSIWYALGFVHSHQEHKEEALRCYQRALAEDPTDVRAYADMVAMFVDDGEIDQARDLLSQGIRAMPQSAHLRALMAMVYVEKKDRRRAQEYLSEAERLNPDLEIVQAIRELVKSL